MTVHSHKHEFQINGRTKHLLLLSVLLVLAFFFGQLALENFIARKTLVRLDAQFLIGSISFLFLCFSSFLAYRQVMVHKAISFSFKKVNHYVKKSFFVSYCDAARRLFARANNHDHHQSTSSTSTGLLPA